MNVALIYLPVFELLINTAYYYKSMCFLLNVMPSHDRIFKLVYVFDYYFHYLFCVTDYIITLSIFVDNRYLIYNEKIS